jgi:hypothetical protein
VPLLPAAASPRAGQVGALIAGGALAAAAAATTPFTWEADAVTAFPLVVVAVLVVVMWPLRRPSLPRIAPASPRAHPFAGWLAVLTAFIAWELVNYLARGSRADHPTFSSMTDAVDRFRALKAVLFLLWLLLGREVVRRGRSVTALP